MLRKFFVAALPAGLLLLASGALAETLPYPTPADMPPDAKPGECYARVYVPAMFETEVDQVLVKSAAERLEIVPAQYGTVTEQVMVKPATTQLVEVPAVYGWEEQVIETAPARIEWKKGPCALNQIPNATGECMCLVEIPAKYRTVQRKVMTQPPTTREVAIPAEYKTITKIVETRPASEQRIAIPAEYTTVSREVKVSEPQLKWQIIDCKYGNPLYDRETTLVLQRSLKDKGFDPGPIDGIFGPLTRGALERFQETNGIAHEGLGEATRKGLGLPAGS